MLCEEYLCKEVPTSSTHIITRNRRPIRGLDFQSTAVAAFLHSHPTSETTVSDTHWSKMLCRNLGVPVYMDSRALQFQHFGKPLDICGELVIFICTSGFGRIHHHHHDFIRNVLAYHVSRAARLDFQFQTPLLVPGINLR